MDQGGTGMKKKKLISLLLAATCIGSMALTGCEKKKKVEERKQIMNFRQLHLHMDIIRMKPNGLQRQR